MRLTIVAPGSRGDVQPFVALGRGLSEAGYQVKIATYRHFADFVGRYGLEFAPIEGDPRQALEAQAGQHWMESGKSLVKFMRRLRDLSTYESLHKSLNDTVEACRGTDAILYSPLGAAGYHVAERMGVPALYLLLQPISRSREIPSIFAPALPFGGTYNWWTNIMAEQLVWQAVRTKINRWRRETLKLEPIPFGGPFNLLYRKHAPFIYGFSQHVVQRPHDWPEWHHITGYWFLDGAQEWSSPPELLDFLSGEPRPIYLGFGSMSGHIARNLVDLAVEAVMMTTQRAVLLGGWAVAHDLDLPDSIYALESAPHDWLFPHMAAVIHHGGAGTVAAGLRAGVPSIIIPFFGDQPYWGQRVHALGVGPRPILRKKLTAEKLAAAIEQAVHDESMRQRAAEVGAAIRAEDGIGEAIRHIERYIL
jgi:sterol 3beta-glucosyltransferase